MWMCYTMGSDMSMTQKSLTDTKVAGMDAKICGCIPFSPVPCCLCCGVGPCKPEFRFEQDKAEPTKWVAVDSVFPYSCCTSCTQHPGDFFYFDTEHNGSAEKPMEMTAGENPMNPPCFWGKKIGLFKFAKGGAPDVAAMSR